MKQIALDNIEYRVTNHRQYFMGVAMILVVLYHCYTAVEDSFILRFFYKGYIGVDVFLFFSGLGCSFSYDKHTIRRFYKNRFIRIMPLFWIWAGVHLIVTCINENNSTNVNDVIGLFTTLSYMGGVGSVRSNWYLSALIIFYAVFPFLFWGVKKFRIHFVTLVAIATAILLALYDFYWYHAAFIGRFYIFSLGILVYFCIKQRSFSKYDYFMIGVLCLVGAFSIFIGRFQFWGASCLCPLLIIALATLPQNLVDSKIISLCGKYSLEIFIANCWTMLLMQYTTYGNIYSQCVVYFVSNIIFAIILVYINRILTKLVS